MQTDEQMKQSLEGAEPEQVIEVLYNELVTLLRNDPDYFSGGRSNSPVHTLRAIIRLIEAK